MMENKIASLRPLYGEFAKFNEEVFARLLGAGKKLVAKVKNAVIMPEYCSLEISVVMIDY